MAVDHQLSDFWRIKIYDIIFLSFDEPEAEQNFASLKVRFPQTKRVHGVKGIAAAHHAAAKKAMTKMFYVVDGDSVVHSNFNFSYVPEPAQQKSTHVWRALNPVLGISYGYGGVKLFAKSNFNADNAVMKNLDFTTTVTDKFVVMPEIASTTKFNTSTFHTFRAAMRESAKLSAYIANEAIDERWRKQAQERLDLWLNPVECDFRECALLGAELGVSAFKYGGTEGVKFINDFGALSYLYQKYIEEEASGKVAFFLKEYYDTI